MIIARILHKTQWDIAKRSTTIWLIICQTYWRASTDDDERLDSEKSMWKPHQNVKRKLWWPYHKVSGIVKTLCLHNRSEAHLLGFSSTQWQKESFKSTNLYKWVGHHSCLAAADDIQHVHTTWGKHKDAADLDHCWWRILNNNLQKSTITFYHLSFSIKLVYIDCRLTVSSG